ncbi:MAG: sulfotransferase family protein [Vicinamibacteria bacterium]|nr:sulfotransferase family protein [Vicinamibacteria bacterium]
MIVSMPRRVLFVHVHRTGGSTLRSLLLQRLPGAARLGSQHSPITEARGLLGEEFDDYFKFAFVRNPWDRIVSWWMLLRQGPRPPGSAGSTIPDTLEGYLLLCRDALIRGGPRPFPAEQMSLLTDGEGPILVDELGRYENFDADARRICMRLGIGIEELPRAAATRHDHYATYYNDSARRLVAELYPRDLRGLGYEF